LKRLGYYFFFYWVSAALFFYYKKIEVVGVENVPLDKPLLFLSNHQNALMDILLIATRCKRKPWYLTRADVFKSRIFKPLFAFLQMLPVYRLRDGKSNLPKNKEIFRECGQLLEHREAILLFPEANHNLNRRVRPLSKGFTRIIDAAFTANPNIDLQLIPIGQNYQSPTSAGDKATLYFGEPISVRQFRNKEDFAQRVKQVVFDELTNLTTHIDEENYNMVMEKLERFNVDFTKPTEVNERFAKNGFENVPKKTNNAATLVFRFLFRLINIPMIFLWRLLLKPKLPEPEFEATFRFGFVLLVYPLVYTLSLIVLGTIYNAKTACLFVFGHAVFNLILLKMGITSSNQRK